ncbi:MAG: hypothetical protein K0Q60_3754 [Microvirga sp.]|jgi:hypothetical protein|nr:hypothetical protein [Microvirga sp.]
MAGEHEFVRADCLEHIKDLERAFRERDTVLATGLHAIGRNCPYVELPIDLWPSRTKHFS